MTSFTTSMVTPSINTTGPPSFPPRIQADRILGAPFVGNLAAGILYGVACLQTYVVFRQKKDRLWLRTLVSLLWVLASLHLVSVSSVLFFWLITNYGNPTALYTQNVWAATTYYVVTAIMEFTIRGVFMLRTWKLSQHNWLPTSMIFITSLLNLGISIACLLLIQKSDVNNDSHLLGQSLSWKLGLSIKTFPDLSSISWLYYMAYGGSIAADVITTVSLCIYLRKQSTGFKRTDSFIKSLMVYSVNTAALSSICSLMVLVTYAVSNQFIYAFFYFMLPGVMLNSLLATLDASHRLWDRTQARDSNEESRSAIVFSVPMRVMNTSPWTLARFDGEVERVDKAVKCSTVQGTDADAPLRVSIP